MNDINLALERLFEKHRIVFWYDDEHELRQEYESLTLDGVHKVEIRNNEFGLKYRLLRQEPDAKFLLYHDGPQPPDDENWLLDVLLAQGRFRTDRISLWLSEMGLGTERWELVTQHEAFFSSSARRAAFKQISTSEDSADAMRLKVLAVCVDSHADSHFESILQLLLEEHANEEDAKITLIADCGLADFLWEQARKAFAYDSDTKSIKDLAISLFKAGYALELGEETTLSQEALFFLRRWKDSVRFRNAFGTLSERTADILHIEQDLLHRELPSLKEVDLFQLVDQRVLSELVGQVADRAITARACSEIVRLRRSSHWFDAYRYLYEAIEVGAQFMDTFAQMDLHIQSLSDGIAKYTNAWYQIDQLYRRYIFHARASNQTTLLQALTERIENVYSNKFLLPLNDNWQGVLDRAERWEAPPVVRQDEFYANWVEVTAANKRVVVIISDGLRYEIGEELVHRIQQKARYDAELQAILSMLPSYTQLGMAALLPHETLSITEDGTVWADGQRTQGLENRLKLLEKALPGQVAAVRAEELLQMNRQACRTLLQSGQVLYVYHNRIDAVGDKRESEDRTVEAVEETLRELVDMIKKLANANASTFIVTADHGFLYQHRAIDESEFAAVDTAAGTATYRDRRFILGSGFDHESSLLHLTPAQLSIESPVSVYIPRSINRLRLQGAGSRYVHGGASLQEVVLPVLTVSVKRESDLSQVEVDVIRSASPLITTGQITVAFYQKEPVTDKRKPRTLRAGIYTLNGVLISDSHEITFDLTTDNAREREAKRTFILGRNADDVNGQEVVLKLEEQIPGTSHYTEYKSVRYQVRRSFTSDFDV